MKLLRLAIIKFDPLLKKDNWGMTMGEIKVKVLNTLKTKEGNYNGTLVAAEINLPKFPELDKGYVLIPEIERKNAEFAIETYANLLAVTKKRKRSISSPTPNIVFLANKSEKNWLNKTKGIRYPTNIVQMQFDYEIDLDEKLIKKLGDRLDGVALLSEAVSVGHATGKFHEFMRLFERAFGLSSKKLIPPLSEFLKDKKYSIQQIHDWIYKIRHPATHADIRKEILFESEISPEISLIQQAAYDVLFNKKKWHDPSPERRDVFEAPVGVLTDKKGIFVAQGTKGLTLDFHLLDKFASFPMNLEAIMRNLPSDWWCKEDPEINKKNIPSASPQ